MEGHRLDPDNWEEFAVQMHHNLDLCLSRMQNSRQLPWKPKPESMRAAMVLSTSGEGVDSKTIFDQIATDILPYSVGNTHPRY